MNILPPKLTQSSTVLSGTTQFLCTLAVTSVICLVSAGCEDMAGAVMEKAIESDVGGSPKRASFAAKFRRVKEECPVTVNEYLTLEWVKMKGLNRIEFRYRVSESGRPFVNMNKWMDLNPEIIQRTADSPLAESVEALDLSVDHVFKDTDGIQMYSKTVTKMDLKKAKLKAAVAEKRKKAEAKLAQTKAKADAAKPKGLTITTLDASSAFDSVDVTNPVMNGGSSTTQVKNGQASSTTDDWTPEQWQGPERNSSNPAGVQSNPYAN
ncbi:hypothetical protein [Planctomycetes bacterium K23_9]